MKSRSFHFQSLLVLGSLALFGASSTATAQEFVAKPGVKEFTGTMHVRFAQTADLIARGFAADRIGAVRQQAMANVSGQIVRYYPEVDMALVKLPKGQTENSYSQALMSTKMYEYVTPNWRLYPLAARTPNDPRFPNQWHHKVMKSADAWGVWTGTSNVTIAVVDTGVMITHPDLQGGIVSGYNSVDRKAQVDGGQVVDINGHGTHVAGDAAAQGNNSVGVVGEGWRFKIMPIRTSNDAGGGASGDDIFAGARWAAEHGARVVSASYSGVDDPAVGTTGTYLKSKGALFLYAAGNDARDLTGFSYKDTIVVGASNQSDGRAGFSAYGRGVSVFAPGAGILSTTMDGGYAEFSGTSMSTPVANGACALIFSINPSLTPTKAQQILYSTCDQIGSPAIFGNGRINLYKAALAAKASLNQKIDFAPLAISVLQGTYVSGSLNNVQTGTGSGYVTKSATVTTVGHSMVDALTYKLNFATNRLRLLHPQIKVSTNVGVSGTAMLYIYDLVKKQYVQVKAAPMPVDGTTLTLEIDVPSNLANYVAADGTVKVGARIMSGVGRRGAPGSEFDGKLVFAKLATEAAN